MINFIGGLVVGGIIAIFVYRNNQKQISKYADQVDNLVMQLKEAKKKK